MGAREEVEMAWARSTSVPRRAVVGAAAVLVLVAGAAPLRSDATAARDPRRDEVQALGWLAGRWVGQAGGVAMEEQWTPRGGVLLGVHSDVKDERLVSWEFLRIATTQDGTFYFASPRSAPPVAFRLKEAGGRRVVFENLAHDFPQRILYWLDGAGDLHARIEGPRGNEIAAEEWVWKKAP
jgi:hypothetical protein